MLNLIQKVFLAVCLIALLAACGETHTGLDGQYIMIDGKVYRLHSKYYDTYWLKLIDLEEINKIQDMRGS